MKIVIKMQDIMDLVFVLQKDMNAKKHVIIRIILEVDVLKNVQKKQDIKMNIFVQIKGKTINVMGYVI